MQLICVLGKFKGFSYFKWKKDLSIKRIRELLVKEMFYFLRVVFTCGHWVFRVYIFHVSNESRILSSVP